MSFQPSRFTSLRFDFGMENWIRLGPLTVAVASAGRSVDPDYQAPSTVLPVQYLPQTRENTTSTSPTHHRLPMTEVESTVPADGFLRLDSGSLD
jgi:hypothetical protein